MALERKGQDESRTVYGRADRRHFTGSPQGREAYHRKEKGIKETTFYSWRKTFDGMQVKQAQRLKDLEKKNARLKRLLAERDLEIV